MEKERDGVKREIRANREMDMRKGDRRLKKTTKVKMLQK